MPKFNRQVASDILREVTELMDGIGTGTFLIQGTALGAYRDGDFVPSEKDIDIGFLAEEVTTYSMVNEVIPTFIHAGYEIQTIRKPFTSIRTLVLRKNLIKVDMVGYMRWENCRFATRPLDERMLEPYSIVHAASMLEDYDTVEMHSITYHVPSPIEEYLEREYGEDWRTPKEDHVSRTRIYNFVFDNNIPLDLGDSNDFP